MSVIVDSPEQSAVITADADADMLVVAGAGSGKTYTMTRRIIELIAGGISPERILGLTFTRKAAGELQSRVSAAIANTATDGTAAGDATADDRLFLKPTVQTYDAFFQTIVRQYGLLVGIDQDTQPLSDAGTMQLVNTVVDRHLEELFAAGFTTYQNVGTSVHALSEAISSSMIGNGCSDIADAIARVRRWDAAFLARLEAAIGDDPIPETQPSLGKVPKEEQSAVQHSLCVYQCDQLAQTVRQREVLLNLVEEYEAEKRRLNLAEFSDFTIAAYQLVTRFPSIGQRYRGRFSHVLLDEYQDTSTTQAALIATLFHPSDDAAQRSAVSAVGDPFQSIYAWRGASPGAFLMFQQDFRISKAGFHALSTTRRNSRIVLEAANDLTLPLRSTPRRASSAALSEVNVDALTNLPDTDTGTLGVLQYGTLGQQIDGVVRFCHEAIRRHTRTNADGTVHRGTVAVLFRTKKDIVAYQQALEQSGLTTFVVGYSALLERPEIVDLLSLLRAISDHTDSKDMMTILATPRFGLGTEELTLLSTLATRLNMEAQFRTLVAAGIADANTPRAQWDAIVTEHRDHVSNVVFLTDVLLRDDLAALVNREDGLSGEASNAIIRAGHVVTSVQATVGRSLTETIRAAVEALDIDIDTVVAQAMRGTDLSTNPTIARMPLNVILDMVATYTSELLEGQTPTLRGFMSWVDALRAVEDEAAGMHDEVADVELMSIHQSKGLEWDAVAIVNMHQGKFPSNTGDRLSITLDEDHMGGYRDGRWTAPEYHETSRTWLSDATAVPVPMRADAAILPLFPHDCAVGGDPIEALATLEDVEQIDDEVFGSLRSCGDGVEDVDPDSWYLDQEEEYGRRAHADERRLAYVALTRARHDAMLSYSCSQQEYRPSTAAEVPSSRLSKPSNFWQELYDAFHARPDAVYQPDNCDEATDKAIHDGTLPPLPGGFFVGDHARAYENAVVGDAWMTPVAKQSPDGVLPWPVESSPELAARLDTAAQAVYDALQHADAHDDRGGELYRRTRMVIDDADLMTSAMDENQLDELVRAEARRTLMHQRQNVTGLQALAGGLSEREERMHWRGIVRPIPHVPSPSAAAGTEFHQWAERFIAADHLDTGDNMETRDGLLAELERHMAAVNEDVTDSRQRNAALGRLEWRRRLAASPWAKREPVALEQQIVAAVPPLDGMIVNGKLDAVFRGGIDPQNPGKRYTVIDWKTGRRPTQADDMTRKLIQLDCYRLLLSVFEHVPLDAIDAALYYVSEPNESRRELRASMKTEEEILAEIRQGLPGQSDED